MALSLRYSARSTRGHIRENNEDGVYAGPRLLVLADGMGGHAAGEVASSLTISALAPLDDDQTPDDPLVALSEAAARANRAIADHVAEHPEAEGMGTTLTALLFVDDRLGLVHVGDSRAYMFRDGSLSQITKDETMVQSLIDAGRLTEEEAWNHPQRSVVLRALMGREVDPAMALLEARVGDRYMLCSDGLSDVIPAETIAETLRTPDPQRCTEELIQLALRAESRDNVTCVVADVVDVDPGYDIPIVSGAARYDDAMTRGRTTS